MSLCAHNVNLNHRRCDRCEEIAEAEHRIRLRDSTATGVRAKQQRVQMLIKQAKQYAHCNCPEDELTGRVTYHSNCQAKLMPILEELERLL